MSAIVPPLDYIPKLPGMAASKVVQELNKQTDKLAETVSKTVKDTIKLPSNVKCDDPRIKKIKQQLADVQKQLTTIQQTIPKIQTTINSVKTVVGTAVAIKSAITAAQLSNPVTAPLFIAQQLMAIQDATIVNAIESLNQFTSFPITLQSKISIIIPPLQDSISKLTNICGNTDPNINVQVPGSLVNSDNNVDYNDLLETQFYTEYNVSDSDLQQRSDAIESLVEQQQNLLNSLQEAPSKVYQGEGAPLSTIGKPGDYYIDTNTQTVYGPKPSINSWI